jgi:hypothetical protein
MTIRGAAALSVATCATVCLTLAVSVTPAAAAAGSIQITRVYVNSPGSDTGSNSSLNTEYVSIKNTGTTNRSLKGYTLRDKSRHVYTFGTFTLGAGRTVVVRSGKGTSTTRNRYWNRSWYVWNNSGGDSATLRTAAGSYVDRCSWGTVSSYMNC